MSCLCLQAVTDYLITGKLAFLVYLCGYILKHILGRSPIIWGHRPDMTIAVDHYENMYMQYTEIF